MTSEEFEAAYQRAQSNYQKAIELMNSDSPFMKALPEKLDSTKQKLKNRASEISVCKVGAEGMQRVMLYRDFITRLSALNTAFANYFQESPGLWKRFNELLDIYGKLCTVNEHFPTTAITAIEWVTQLEETSMKLLQSYREINNRIVPLRQQYHQLMQQAQPYLN